VPPCAGRGSILMRARCAIEEIRKDRKPSSSPKFPTCEQGAAAERIAELCATSDRGNSESATKATVMACGVISSSATLRRSGLKPASNRLSSQLQTTSASTCCANNGRPLQMNLKN